MLDRLDPAELDQLARHFADPVPSSEGAPSVGFAEMVRSFNAPGLMHNGLTDGENRELLTTRDPDTITTLVWRSVHKIGSQHAF